MSTDELTHEVHKLFVEKENRQEYFKHIAETIEDHALKVTTLTQLCGRFVTSVQLGRQQDHPERDADN